MKNLVRILITLSLMTSFVSAYDKPGQTPKPKPIILKPSTKDYVFGPTTDGSSLTALNASQLTSGTVPAARITGQAYSLTSPSGGASVPFTLTADASQSANLFEFKDSNGNLMSNIFPNGSFGPWRMIRGAKGALTISSIAYADPVVTITTTGAHGLVVGDPISISGSTPALYNGFYTVATVTSSTVFTLNNANTVGLGAYVSGAVVTARGGIQYGGTCTSPSSLYDNSFTAAGINDTALAVFPASTSQAAAIFLTADTFGGFSSLVTGGTPSWQFTRIGSFATAASTISSVAFSGTTATITYSAAHGICKGRRILPGLVTNTALNGATNSRWIVTTVPTKNTLTYTITPPTVYITNVSGDGTTATLTTGAAHGLSAGSFVTIAGLTNTGFNVTNVAVASTPTTTTFTYLNATNLGSTADNGTSTLVSVTAGTADTGTTNTQGVIDVNTPVNGAVQTQTTMNITSGASIAPLSITSDSTSEAVDLTQWQNSFGTKVASITNVGTFSGFRVAAPVALNATVTRVSFSGTTATIVCALPHAMVVGRIIGGAITTNTLLNGPANTGYQIVTVPDAYSLTYTITPTVPAINNVAGDGTTATLTTAAAHGFGIGAVVTVAGLTNTGFNASSVTVTAVPSTTTFKYLNATNLGSTGDTGTVTLVSLTSLTDTGTITARATTCYGSNAVNASTMNTSTNIFVAALVSSVPLASQGITSQTGNLFNCVSSTGSVLFGVASGGVTTIAPGSDTAGLIIKQFTDTPASTAVGLKLTLLTAGSTVQLGSIPGTPADGMAAFGNITPSSTLWHARGNATNVFINAATTGHLQIAGNATDVLSWNVTNLFMGKGIWNPFKAANVASTATMPAPIGNVYHVTGTTGITGFTSTGINAGTTVTWIFDGILTVTSATALYLSGGANYTSAVSDTLTLTFDGTNWIETGRGKAPSGIAFSAITVGTNTAALLVGAGGSLGPTSTGTITATTTASDSSQNTKGGSLTPASFSGASRNTLFGYSIMQTAAQTGSDNTCFGWSTMSSQGPASLRNSVFGSNAGASIGSNSTATTENCFFGFGAGNGITNGGDNCFFGANTVGAATVNGQIAIGSGATTTATAQCVFGSAGFPATDVYFGNGINGSTSATYQINGAGGLGSNNAGSDFYLIGGKGTGTAADGRVGFKYPLTTTTGSTLHTVSTLISVPIGVIYTSTATTTLTANTSTTGTIIGAQTGVSPAGTLTIDAGAWRPGRRFKVRVRGLITTSVAGPTLKVDIKLGSTVIATSGAVAPISGITNGTFAVEADGVCVSIGASGTIQGDGFELQGNPTTFVSQTYSLNKSITTVDTTASQAVDCFLTWSAGTAGNSVQSTIVDVIWGN